MFLVKSVLRLFAVGIFGSFAVNASAQDEEISQQSSPQLVTGRWDTDTNGCKVWNPAPVPNEAVTWSGDCVNGFANGYGTETWYEDGKVGNVIIGTIVNGRFSGTVTVNYPNKTVYKGRLSYSGQGGPDGDGLYTSTSGRVFHVSYLNGKRTRIFPENPTPNEMKCSKLGWNYGSRDFRQCLLRLNQIAQQTERPVYITTSDTGSEFYYDANSIRASEGQVMVWLSQDAKKDKTVKFRTSKQRLVFDCNSENSKLVQYVAYNSVGRVIDQYNPSEFEQKWEGVIPGSIGAALFISVCPIR